MVDSASAHGYLGATVSQVVDRAGVSRATFYEHFTQREECFLAAYREQLGDVVSTVRKNAETVAQGERPAAVLGLLADRLDEDPAGSRLLLVEALAAPASVREEHEKLIAGVDAVVAGFLDEQAAEAAIQIPSTALMAGIADVLARRALEDGVGDRRKLRAELTRWIDAYRLPPGCRALPQSHWRELGRFAKLVSPPGSDRPSLLPRGRSALPEDQVAGARRGRILDAIARLSREEGYASLTVARVAAAARVPRAAFYSLFEGKQEALMAAQTRGLQESMAAAAAAYSPAAPWPERVGKLARAFLVYLAENPDYAHLDFVESYAAGSQAVRHRQQNHMVFALFLEDGYRHTRVTSRLPGACTEAIAGGVLGLIRQLVVEEKTERMLSLVPAVSYTILAPFIGPREAAAQVEEWAPAAR
jgi:AcrR family transcriptional regulator